jgi:hypothetical protein
LNHRARQPGASPTPIELKQAIIGKAIDLL